MKIDIRGAAMRQFMRYLFVGVINTLVTLVVIYICKSVLGMNQWISNAIGYVAGLINSFVWNKNWVFKSHHDAVMEAVKFGIGFLICYGIQFFVVWFIDTPMALGDLVWHFGFWTLSGYGIATLVGMGVYTVCNFIYNRLITFK